MKSVIMSLVLIHMFGHCVIPGAQARNPAPRYGPEIGLEETGSGGTITGLITDGETEKPLRGVNISVTGTRRGAVSDKKGGFRIQNMNPGTYALVFSRIGYAEITKEGVVVSEDETVDLKIEMFERALLLKEIVVSPGSYSILGAEPSNQVLTGEDIKEMSWAEDVTRAVTRLPGIASSDYSSKFTIRGGESDEVLITLDGMELYEPFHQRDYSGGLFSIVDIETIQGIELNTGGFAADNGNRMSGVFAMRTKNVKDGQRHTSLGLSVTNARAYTDGSFASGKGSYIISARRGMLDVLFDVLPAVEEATLDQGVSPTFYDAMGKVEYELSNIHTASFHVLRAGDRAKLSDVETEDPFLPGFVNFDKNDNHYENTYGWLTLKSFYNPDLYSRTILYSGLLSHDRTGSFAKFEPSDKGTFSLSDQRDYSFFGLKQDWNWQVSPKLALRSGFDVKHLKAKYDYLMNIAELRVDGNEQLFDYDTTVSVDKKPDGNQSALFLTARYDVLPRVVVEAGVRHDYASYTNDNLWSPRLAVAFAAAKKTVLRGAWGYYYQTQFIDDLDVNHGNDKFDRAELAKHYVLGLDHTFSSGVNLRVEGYYKDLSRISPLWQNLRDHLEVFPEQRNDNVRIIYNGSTSKGIEFFMKRDVGGKISWWLSYALANAEDDIKNIEYEGLLVKRTGNVPRLNDQRHTIYADLNYRPTKQWALNLSWQYYKGWPRTDYTYRYQTLSNGDLHFYADHGEYNGTLYPAYHRMDLRINRHFNTSVGRISAFVHLINLYNRENLKKFDLDTRNDDDEFSIDGEGNYVPFRDDTYWFGFLPVLGVSWEF